MTDVEETFSPMFCFQCEQTMGGVACTQSGRCGKSPRIAYLQDEIICGMKSMAVWLRALQQSGQAVPPEYAELLCYSAFVTLTNVNFDDTSHRTCLSRLAEKRDEVRHLVEEEYRRKAAAMPALTSAFAEWTPEWPQTKTRIDVDIRRRGRTIASLQQWIIYGLKGMASYSYHIQRLGRRCEGALNHIVEALAFLVCLPPVPTPISRTPFGMMGGLHQADDPSDQEALFNMVLKTGEVNLETMRVLDQCHCETFGNPEPTPVRRTHVRGHCIAVSGHDLLDLRDVLEATKDIPDLKVYTHGEMLPLSGYPGLKKYPHFVGHYGTAWQNQTKDFSNFPGAILMNTNCLMPVNELYRDRIFTCGPVGFPGVRHLGDGNLRPLIDRALELPGFPDDETPERFYTVGFGHHAIEAVAGKVVEAVKAGKIRRFFLVGGCDGFEPSRNYYTEFAERIPKDCVVLTLACGKYRLNHLDFGDIDGIPRLLDCGQCNDAYSAIVVAVLLSKAFGCGVNDLPLSIILSWFEQKAVVILMTLLSLGIRNMRIGPSLPGFFTPEILKMLKDRFNLMPIRTPEGDLAECLGGGQPAATSTETATTAPPTTPAPA
ncbi:putative Hydroxylamine reductase [Paratrimastix pyriformis]|uniref:Hydroxylamine reductase n=1 Tax=Paratrimastix pyriformis TaxID=342808 RepID=A0ABQ8UUM5_9EUKA|nr:putative Hydroxylamine reductase [Paratrimastix pyriformis]